MIIEFMGLPGSGKTTLHGKAVGFLGKAACEVWTPEHCWEKERPYYRRSFQGSPSDRIINNVLFVHHLLAKVPSLLCYFYIHRHFVFLLLRYINHFPHRFRYRALLTKYFLIDLFQYSSFRKRSMIKNKWILIDEGLVQHVYTLFVHKSGLLDCRAIKSYLRRVPLPDLLIYITADPELCFERMEKRGVIPYRLRGESIEVLRDSLKRGEALFSMVVELIRDQDSRSVEIVRLNGNFIDEATQKLEEILPLFRISGWKRIQNPIEPDLRF